MSEELPVRDQASEPVATNPRNPTAGRMFWIGQANPTAQASSAGVDRERAPLRRRDSGWSNRHVIQGQLEGFPVEQRPIRLRQTLSETTNVDAFVDAVDPNSDVPNLAGRSLRDFSELVGLQPRSISVVVIGEPPCHLVAGTACV